MGSGPPPLNSYSAPSSPSSPVALAICRRIAICLTATAATDRLLVAVAAAALALLLMLLLDSSIMRDIERSLIYKNSETSVCVYRKVR